MRIFVGAALAAALSWAPGAAAATEAPPVRYDHPHRALNILERSYYDVDPLCRKMFPRTRFPAATDTHRILGCAGIGDGVRPCWIIVPKPGEGFITEGRRAEIIRHERAHCNGWPGYHPAG
jgi:hypothetical protein